MHFLYIIFAVTISAIVAKKDPSLLLSPSDIIIHANRTKVPSIRYVLDAVHILREVYTVYPDDEVKAKMYAQLFEDKHMERNWSAVVGCTGFYLNSEFFIETYILGAGDNTPKGDKEKKHNTFLIFSTP